MTKKLSTHELSLIGLMTSVICILGPLSFPLPISPIPISFTNLAIYITVFMLGWKKGSFSYLLYLLIGLIGIPVFSGFSGGISKLAGPTGGYLLGFLFMAIISGYFIERFPKKRGMAILGMILGTIITYLFGTLWLSYQTNATFMQGLTLGVFPFIPGDLAKIILASILGPLLRSRLIQSHLI